MLNVFHWKRRAKRKLVGIEAEIVSENNKEYAGKMEDSLPFGFRNITWHKDLGIIENLSKHGICLKAFPRSSTSEYTPGTIVELLIPSFLGEPLNLRCMVKWSQHIPSDTRACKVGMKIIHPPGKYSNLLKILS